MLPDDLIPTAAATRWPRTKPSCPAPAPAAASRRAVKPTPWTPSGLVLVLHALHLAGQRPGHGGRTQRLLDADGPVHRRDRARGAAPAVRPVLDQGHARHGHAQLRRALHQAAVPGHGAEPHLLAQERPGRHRILLARGGRERLRRARRHHRRQAPVRRLRHHLRRRGHHVQVEEQRRRPAIADRYAGRRHRAPVRHVRQPARADAGMVGFGRGRLEPLPAPPVVHQLRAARSRGARPGPGRRLAGAPAPVRTCVARSTACSSKPTTTISAFSTTPWCRPA